MALTIPSRLQEVVVDLFKLDSSDRDRLIDAVGDVPPGSKFYAYEQRLEDLFPEYSSDWRTKVLTLIFSLANLSGTDKSVDTVVSDFMTALHELDDQSVEDAKADASKNKFQSFEVLIRRILEAQDTMGLGAKAYGLMIEHERTYVYSEVFSDIRSIFSKDGPDKPPIAAIVNHSLKIHYHRSEQHEDIFLTMNYKDLQQLKRIVDRAVAKHHSLSKLVKDFGLHYLEPGDND